MNLWCLDAVETSWGSLWKSEDPRRAGWAQYGHVYWLWTCGKCCFISIYSLIVLSFHWQVDFVQFVFSPIRLRLALQTYVSAALFSAPENTPTPRAPVRKESQRSSVRKQPEKWTGSRSQSNECWGKKGYWTKCGTSWASSQWLGSPFTSQGPYMS